MIRGKATARATTVFVDGIGAAAATSGILTQIQGRIFGLLYLQPGALSLDEIAAELELSKGNVSVQIRGLLEWHLVRRVPVGRSRKDHYEAATDLLRAIQEIMERRFRWNLRQVLSAVDETERAVAATKPAKGADSERAALVARRLAAMRVFFSVFEAGVGAFTRGEAPDAEAMKQLFALARNQGDRMP